MHNRDSFRHVGINSVFCQKPTLKVIDSSNVYFQSLAMYIENADLNPGITNKLARAHPLVYIETNPEISKILPDNFVKYEIKYVGTNFLESATSEKKIIDLLELGTAMLKQDTLSILIYSYSVSWVNRRFFMAKKEEPHLYGNIIV